MLRLSRTLLRVAAWMVLGAVLGSLGVYIHLARQLPDLAPWHVGAPGYDFGEEGPEASFADLLEREHRVMAEVDRLVTEYGSTDATGDITRYSPAGEANPANFPVNWNRTYELVPGPAPVGGALMLHGLSDSPYSMRALAERTHGAGWHVVALRLPGHGTIPGALTSVEWRDWRDAVRVAAHYVADPLPDGAPFVVFGYSNGAALAVEYALGVAEGRDDPPPSLIVALSPAMGVSPVAALARVTLRMALVPGLEKLAWTAIQPEYDPFKYSSFPVKAGEQIYDLTSNVERRLRRLAEEQGPEAFPRVLAFQSVVDATVVGSATLDRLFDPIGANGSELVLFDVNRLAEVEPFIRSAHQQILDRLRAQPSQPFHLTVVGNASDLELAVTVRRRPAGARTWEEEALELAWPPGVYSLSHVALPFPPDDPLYGPRRADHPVELFNIGGIVLHGERGVFGISMDELMRLRFNPFFAYVEARVQAELAAL